MEDYNDLDYSGPYSDTMPCLFTVTLRSVYVTGVDINEPSLYLLPMSI